MEAWSAQVEEFKLNVFLDTNILCYLIDDTYPTLTAFIKELGEMPAVSLFTSQYVLAELIEVRKKEDYYQEVTRRSSIDGRRINISSFIKHNKRYDIPHYSYEGELIAPVKSQVDNDIYRIVNDFHIDFDSKFNEDLLAPMKDICLSTKISREDSLVLVSSQYRGNKRAMTDKVVLLTNDDDFERWSANARSEIETVLIEYGLSMPKVEHIDRLGKMFGDGNTHWNLKSENDGVEIARKYVVDCLKKMYDGSFIGVITPADNAPQAPAHTLFVKMKAPAIDNHLYTVILDKELHFLYCPQNQADFYFEHQSIGESIIKDGRDITLGYVCQMREGEGEDIFNRLNQRGNLVFIHPDSF
jgi:predicted nucleic acid-binding protein